MYNVYLLETIDVLNENINNTSFKIGYTKGKVESRIKQLQTGSDKKLQIKFVYKTKYGSKLESILKRYYKPYNIIGEYFNLSEELVDDFLYICNIFDKGLNSMDINDNHFFKK